MFKKKNYNTKGLPSENIFHDDAILNLEIDRRN